MNFIQLFFTKQVALGAGRLALQWIGAALAAKGLVEIGAWNAQIPTALTALTTMGAGAAFLYGLYTNTRKGLVDRTDALPGVVVLQVKDTQDLSPAAAGNLTRP